MTDILKTPLHALHLELGAKMTPFAGYDMPLQYPAGILKEHLHTRAAAGLFDVSHMGQVILRPRSGKLADAALALERLVPVDILGLGEGRQRYALFTNAQGGILDDLMVTNRVDYLFLVVNAACKDADEAYMRLTLSDACNIERLDNRALLALQGPQAGAVLAAMAPESAGMKFMDVRALTLAGLCLYGSDLDTTTSPVEAALEWAMQKARRYGGDRAGGFPGADRILDELANGAARRRVGLLPEGRAPVRGGTALFAAENDADPVGTVTSGAFGPSLGGPMAMGYVPTALSATGTRLFAEVRGKKLPVTVAAMPFVKPTYKRA